MSLFFRIVISSMSLQHMAVFMNKEKFKSFQRLLSNYMRNFLLTTAAILHTINKPHRRLGVLIEYLV